MNDPEMALYSFPPNASTSVPDPQFSRSMFYNGEHPSVLRSSQAIGKKEHFERSREEEERELLAVTQASFAKRFATCSIDGQPRSYEDRYPSLIAPPNSPTMENSSTMEIRQSADIHHPETESLESYKETAAPYGRRPRMHDTPMEMNGSYQDPDSRAFKWTPIVKPLSHSRKAEYGDQTTTNVQEREGEYERPRPQYPVAANTNARGSNAETSYQPSHPGQQRSRQQGRSGETGENFPRLGQDQTLRDRPLQEPRRIYRCLNSPHQLKKAAILHDSGYGNSELQHTPKPIVRTNPYTGCWDPKNFPPRGERLQSQRAVEPATNDAATRELRGDQERHNMEDHQQYAVPPSQISDMTAKPKAMLLTEAEYRQRMDEGPTITTMASPVLGIFADIRWHAEKVEDLIRGIIREAPVKAVDKMKGAISSTSFKQELLETVAEFHEHMLRGHETVFETIDSNSHETCPYASLFRDLARERVDLCYGEVSIKPQN